MKKIFLKKYATKYLPNYIIKRKKKGFEIPIKEWLRNELKNWAKSTIYNINNYENLPIDQKKVIHLLDLHLSNKRNVHPYLWSILMLLEFNRKRLLK